MDPQNPNQPTLQVSNPLNSMQPGEQNLFELKRHPVGLIGTFVGAGILIIILAVVCFIVLPLALGSAHHTEAIELGALIFIIVGLLVTGYVFVADKVYWGNRWILTSDSLTQVQQVSLFNRQSSQLSLGNLEDVTTEQNGVLQKMFKFGLLRVETAGERSKFVFAYCPNPEQYAQQILQAREQFEQRTSPEDRQRLYREEGSYAPPSYPQAGQPQQPSVPQPQPGYQAPPPYTYPPSQQPPVDPGVNVNTES